VYFFSSIHKVIAQKYKKQSHEVLGGAFCLLVEAAGSKIPSQAKVRLAWGTGASSASFLGVHGYVGYLWDAKRPAYDRYEGVLL
jgi:hypothetical protein